MEIQWPLILFSLLAGIGGALLACIAVAEIRGCGKKANSSAAIAALVCLCIGGVASVAHLAHPGNVMSAITNLGSLSGISLELIFLASTGVFGLVYLLMAIREIGSASARRAIAVICGILGVILSYVCGHGYVIEAQPAWNTEAVALAYAGTALASGAFAYYLIASKSGELDDVAPAMRPACLGTGILCFVLVAVYIACVWSMASSIAPATAAIAFVASIGALACAVKVYKAPSEQYILIGLACAVIAGVAIRVLMWQLGVGYINFFGIAANSPVMLNLG